MSRLASRHAIVTRAVDFLGNGMATTAAIVDHLLAEGLELGDSPVDHVEAALEVDGIVDLIGAWAHPTSVLSGPIWRLDLPVDADDVLEMDGSLASLGWWPDSTPLSRPEGDELEFEIGPNTILGPDGWLRSFAGRTVEVSIVNDVLHITPASDSTVDPSAMAAAIRRSFEREVQAYASFGLPSSKVDLSNLLLEALALDRAGFLKQPIPALELLLDGAGLESNGLLVADKGSVNWAADEAERTDLRLASEYRLSPNEADFFKAAMGASLMYLDGDPTFGGEHDNPEGSALFISTCLATRNASRAFLAEHQHRDTDDADLLRFAEALLEWVGDGPGCGGPAYIAAVVLDRLHRPVEAEAMATMAVEHDQHPAASITLAGFKADRGDAQGAAALLPKTQADPDDAPEAEILFELAPFLIRPRPPAGRNDPCPCGSGRKYKVCHAGKEVHPLAERAGWLHRKAIRWVHTHARELDATIAYEVAEGTGGDHRVLMQLLESELVGDITLHEAGVFDDFLADREHLLPDDEVILAGTWQTVDRSVFEIVDDRGHEWIVRDLRTGERLQITELHADRRAPKGSYVIGRALPVGDGWRSYGGFVPMPPPLRDRAIDVLDRGDPFEVATLIGWCFAPPTLSNTDGDPLEYHELTWEVPDEAAARVALHAAGLDDGGDTLIFGRPGLGGGTTVRAHLTLAGGKLTATVNSERRADEIEALVEAAVPGALLIDHDVRSMDELPPSGPSTALSPQDPRVADVLRQSALAFEANWLDDHVPALGGLTPREAAIDPIARIDLERLLDSMPDTDQPGAMNTHRLRAALGI